MKVSYVEGLANHNGPESCGTARESGNTRASGITLRPSANGNFRGVAEDVQESEVVCAGD